VARGPCAHSQRVLTKRAANVWLFHDQKRVRNSDAGRPDHLEHLRYVRLGGGPISAELTERLDALGMIVTRAYGCTEHLSVMTSALDTPREERLYTEGRPLLGVEVRVVSEDGPASRGGRRASFRPAARICSKATPTRGSPWRP